MEQTVNMEDQIENAKSAINNLVNDTSSGLGERLEALEEIKVELNEAIMDLEDGIVVSALFK